MVFNSAFAEKTKIDPVGMGMKATDRFPPGGEHRAQ